MSFVIIAGILSPSFIFIGNSLLVVKILKCSLLYLTQGQIREKFGTAEDQCEDIRTETCIVTGT